MLSFFELFYEQLLKLILVWHPVMFNKNDAKASSNEMIKDECSGGFPFSNA